MTIGRPTRAQLEAVAQDLNFEFEADDLDFFAAMLQPSFAAYDILDGLADYGPAVRYPRTPGYRPAAEENPHNAWFVKSEVRGASEGKLFGRTVALKDNICLAGVAMMNGSSTLEGYVPDVDATVVTRILDAGGIITGKANCEHFCLSAGSHTNPTGPTHNPHRWGYTTGGSSSGSAALVAAGDADMALGGDQGGSIRVPAAHCGIYGLKPTVGLVPYTGIMPIEATLDHVGPMTRNVADNALLLEVIAGPDGLDPRQGINGAPSDYGSVLGLGASGLRIGIVREGFGHTDSEADVDAKVRAAASQFAELGATVEEVSVPMHPLGAVLWLAIASEGSVGAMMNGNVFGTGWRGHYVTSLRTAHAAWRTQTGELSDTLKLVMMLGQYFSKHHHGRFYAKAQNISRLLRTVYNDALSRRDLLLMPTSPTKAGLIPELDAPRQHRMQVAAGSLANTSAFNVTGHPAMSVPCGIIDGLPVGMMLIARHHDEATIYRAAAAFEANVTWSQC